MKELVQKRIMELNAKQDTAGNPAEATFMPKKLVSLPPSQTQSKELNFKDFLKYVQEQKMDKASRSGCTTGENSVKYTPGRFPLAKRCFN